MHSALDAVTGHAPPRGSAPTVTGEQPLGPLTAVRRRLEFPHVFASAVVRYLLLVLPAVTRELGHWRTRAAEIPDPDLRRTAVRALAKRGNIEGAALFAVLAPAVHRRRTARALVAFQTAYNYLDALSELPSENAIANGDRLHQALLVALHPGASHLDYYAHHPHNRDGGYLNGLVDACRNALAGLPSYASVAAHAWRAAARIVDFQALNLSDAQGGPEALERWASEETPPGSGLEWWQTAAGAGSSLAVHALIAAAAQPDLDPGDARHIDCAYFPLIGALHSLLDSLVDRSEDHDKGQRSLLDHSPTDAAIHLGGLAMRARDAAQLLPRPSAHRVILTAMCSYYLSAPQCRTSEAQAVAQAVERVLGRPLGVAVLMFRARRLVHTATLRPYT